MVRRSMRKIPRGGFQSQTAAAAAALAGQAANAYRKNRKRKRKGKVVPDSQINLTPQDISSAKNGKITKRVKKKLTSPKSLRAHKTEVELAEIEVNGKVKTTVCTEEREVELAPPVTPYVPFVPSLPNQQLKPAFTVGSGKPKDNLGGRSLFGSQLKLPQGSTLKSTFRFGRSAMPSRDVAVPVDITMYGSDIGTNFSGGEATQALAKSPSMLNRKVGLNTIHTIFMGIELPNLAYKRLLTTKKFTRTAVNDVTSDILREMYDVPLADGDATSDESKGGTRSIYCPHQRHGSFTITNLQKFLSFKVKVHICQFRPLQQLYVDKTFIDPAKQIQFVYNALPENSIITSRANCPVTKPLIDKNLTKNSEVWGLHNNDEVKEAIGTWEFETQYPTRLSSSPRFDESVRILKTQSYNVGPGSTRKIDVIRNLNTLWSAYGNYDNVTPATIASRGKFDTASRLFLMVEIHGQKEVNYYQAAKDANGDVTRTWSLADTGPAIFATSVEYKAQVASVPRLLEDGNDAGICYRRNYLNLPNMTDTSRQITIPHNRIADSEESIADGTTKFILPVMTEEGSSVAAGLARAVLNKQE